MLRSFLKNERANISLHQNQPNSLSLEALEDRMMLSSVEIFAAGATGEENLDLLVNGEVVQTFFNVAAMHLRGSLKGLPLKPIKR